MNTLQYVEKVFYSVSRGLPESEVKLYRTSIEANLPRALQRLSTRAAKGALGDSKKALLQKSYSLTLTSGDVAVSSTMVVESLPGAYLLLSGVTQPLVFLPNYQDLLFPPNLSDYNFFTVHENKIKVRTNAGAAPSATALTVICSYEPVLSEVPPDMEDDLIDIGVELALEGQSLDATEKEAEGEN